MKEVIKTKQFKIGFTILSLCCSIIAVTTIFTYKAFNDQGVYVAYRRLSAFTNISNISVLFFTIWTLIRFFIKDNKHPEIYTFTKLLVSIMIFLTFVVFGLILTPGIYITHNPFNPFDLRSTFNHWVVPIIFLINAFFINNEERPLTKKECLWGIVPAMVYYFTWMVVGSCLNPKHFEYPFMDYTKIGWLFEGKWHFGVIPFFILIFAMLVGLVFLYRYLNNRFTSYTKKEVKTDTIE